MKQWVPRALRIAPALDAARHCAPPTPRTALLINPFYPKDPHASFGKHVLTPSLALTSIAAGTPGDWEVRYWDENLLLGPPPCEPFPQVVGITVHLTFAQRAYELARWYRQRGAKVVFGGLHVISCPDEAAPHADAIAIGEGVQLWGRILEDVAAGRLQRVYRGDYRRPYRDDPAPRRDLLPRRGFLTTTSLIATRGCHNRCGFCYLSTRGLHMPYLTRDVEQVAAEFAADEQPYAVFIDNNLGSRPEYLASLCTALAPLEKIWSAAVSIDVTDDPRLVRQMALAGCTGVFVGFESLEDKNIVAAGKRSPTTDDYARRVAILHDNGIQVNGSFVLGFDHDRPGVFAKTVDWIEAQSAGVRHVSRPHAVPGHAAVRANAGRRPDPASRLDPLRHGARRLPAAADDRRRAGRGLRLVLRAVVLARLDLAPPAPGPAGDPPLPGDVVSLQAVEPLLALAHPPSVDRGGLAAAGRMDAAPASALSPALGPGRAGRPPRRQRGLGRRVRGPARGRKTSGRRVAHLEQWAAGPRRARPARDIALQSRPSLS